MIIQRTALDRFIEQTERDRKMMERAFPSALSEFTRLQNSIYAVQPYWDLGDAIKQLEANRRLQVSTGALGADLALWEELRRSEVDSFQEAIKRAMPDLSTFTEAIRSLSDSAAIGIPQSQILDYLDQFGFGFLDSEIEYSEEDQQEWQEGESELIVPKDFRHEIVQVQAIPPRLMYLLRKHPERYLPELHGKDAWKLFEEFIAETVEMIGGRDVVLTRNSKKGDYGLDIVGTFLVDGIKTVFGFQCKGNHPRLKVKAEKARELGGAVSMPPHYAERGVLCTTSSFQPRAREYFLQRVDCEGWDPADIARVIRNRSITSSSKS